MKLDAITSKGAENLYRHPKTGIIYFKMYRKGRGEKIKSTRTKLLNEAKLIGDQYKVQFFGATPKIKTGKKFCGELFPEWIERKRLTCRDKTMLSMEGSWAHLKPFIETMLPDELTAKWWEMTYVVEKRQRTHDSRKFFNDRKWLAMFLLSLKRDGILEQTPMLIDVDEESEVGKVYKDDEIRRLLEKATTQLHLAILMAYTMGMRIGEIIGLSWERIDMDARTIHLRIQDTKIKKTRTFRISSRVYEILARMKPHSPKAPLLRSRLSKDRPLNEKGFNMPWRRCRHAAKITGRFHDLRHTFLTKAFKQAINPALICDYAGLSLQEAYDTYLHFDTNDTAVVAELVQAPEVTLEPKFTKWGRNITQRPWALEIH